MRSYGIIYSMHILLLGHRCLANALLLLHHPLLILLLIFLFCFTFYMKLCAGLWERGWTSLCGGDGEHELLLWRHRGLWPCFPSVDTFCLCPSAVAIRRSALSVGHRHHRRCSVAIRPNRRCSTAIRRCPSVFGPLCKHLCPSGLHVCFVPPGL